MHGLVLFLALLLTGSSEEKLPDAPLLPKPALNPAAIVKKTENNDGKIGFIFFTF